MYDRFYTDTGYCHLDLHMNNILIDKERNYWIIDFEYITSEYIDISDILLKNVDYENETYITNTHIYKKFSIYKIELMIFCIIICTICYVVLANRF